MVGDVFIKVIKHMTEQDCSTFHISGLDKAGYPTSIVSSTHFKGFRPRLWVPLSRIPIGRLYRNVVSYIGIGSGLDTAGFTTSTVTHTSFKGSFDYGRRYLRQGYQSDGGTGPPMVTLFIKLNSPVGQSWIHSSVLDTAGYPITSTTYTVTSKPFNECFDFGRGFLLNVTLTRITK